MGSFCQEIDLYQLQKPQAVFYEIVLDFLFFDESIQPHEAKSLSLDITKAQFKLHWSPQWDLENAIERTAIWYKAYFEDRDILKISTEQIEEYY